MRIYTLFLVLFLIACGQEGQAGTDEGLYDPVAPKGSAFIRFVNMTDASVEIKANNKKYAPLEAFNASAYYVAPKGNAGFTVSNKTIEIMIIEGGFYTIAFTGEPILIADSANENRAKATLALYNLSNTRSLSLKAKQGTVGVIEDVEPNAMGTRDINPVKVDLSLHSEGSDDAVLEPIILERGNHYSIISNGEKNIVITATTDTRQ